MADHTIQKDEIGVYEIHLTAGNTVTVDIENVYGFINNRAQISVHDASMPVYVKLGNTIAIKDTTAQIVNAGTWLDIQTGYSDEPATTIALISAADATVSVART
jgi:hypothetical protein